MNEVAKSYHEKVDQFQSALVQSGLPPHSCQWKHTFVPGMYIREIFMPTGSIITSEIHNTEHPFFVLKGVVSVLTEAGEEVIEAPYYGVTKPGTRRVLYVHADTVWVTCHTCKEGETIEDIKKRIIVPQSIPTLNSVNQLNQ